MKNVDYDDCKPHMNTYTDAYNAILIPMIVYGFETGEYDIDAIVNDVYGWCDDPEYMGYQDMIEDEDEFMDIIESHKIV